MNSTSSAGNLQSLNLNSYGNSSLILNKLNSYRNDKEIHAGNK